MIEKINICQSKFFLNCLFNRDFGASKPFDSDEMKGGGEGRGEGLKGKWNAKVKPSDKTVLAASLPELERGPKLANSSWQSEQRHLAEFSGTNGS